MPQVELERNFSALNYFLKAKVFPEDLILNPPHMNMNM